MEKIKKLLNIRIFCAAIMLGYLYSIILTIGKGLLNGDSVTFFFGTCRSTMKWLFLIGIKAIPVVLLFYFVLFVFVYFQGKSDNNVSQVILKRECVLIWILLVLSIIPCFICYYPGITSYDAYDVIAQAMDLYPKSNFQPYIHTLLVTFFMKIEQITGIRYFTVLANSILQILVVSLTEAYIVYKIREMYTSRIAAVLSFCFYAFNPVITIFTIILTKDVLFGSLFALLTIQILKFVNGDGEISVRNYTIFIIVSILSSLFRNNVIYVVLGTGIVTFGILKKNKKKNYLVLLLILMSYFIIVNPIYDFAGIEKSEVQEKLSVPIMQISTVYCKHYNGLTDDQIQMIKKYIPDVELYSPMNAAPIKENFNRNAYNDDSTEFNSLWYDMLLEYPADYIDAFIYLHLPYYYPDLFIDQPYIENSNAANEIYPIVRNDEFSFVRNYYEDTCTNYDGYKQMSGIRLLFSLNTPILVLLIVITLLILTKRRNMILVVLPSLLLWVTYLLGPVSKFRYMYPIVFLYPVFIAIVLKKKKV